MVKSETRRDAATLVRNPSPRLFGKKFRDSKKVKTNHAKTRLRDLSKTFPRFRDPVKIFRDLRLSRYHSPPLLECVELQAKQSHQCVMHFTRGGGGYSLYYPIQPERGTNFRRQVYERVAILLVEVQEGKSVIQVEKRPKRAIKQIHFMAVKKSRKHSGFVIHSYFKDVTFTGKQNSKLL